MTTQDVRIKASRGHLNWALASKFHSLLALAALRFASLRSVCASDKLAMRCANHSVEVCERGKFKMGKTYKIVMIRCIINHMPYTNLIIIIILIIKRHGDRYTSDYAHFTFSDTI